MKRLPHLYRVLLSRESRKRQGRQRDLERTADAGRALRQPAALKSALAVLLSGERQSLAPAAVRALHRCIGNAALQRLALEGPSAPLLRQAMEAAASATRPAAKADADIEALRLTAQARAGAIILRTKHPEIVFTSGKRDVSAQASAMAANIVSSGNRRWIQQTYTASTASAALQKWVDDHPGAVIKAEIARGLELTLNAMSADQQAQISKHLSGAAFDVRPQEEDAEAIKADIAALPGKTRFLQVEGGLVRWHVQF